MGVLAYKLQTFLSGRQVVLCIGVSVIFLRPHVMPRSEGCEAAAATLSAVAGNPVFSLELPSEAALQTDQGIGHG